MEGGAQESAPAATKVVTSSTTPFHPDPRVDPAHGSSCSIGWNSWCTDVSCTKDYCTEEMVHSQTEAVAAHLAPLGWRYITLDDC